MPERLSFYLKRRDEALEFAKEFPNEAANWVRIATEWQTLHDMLARELGQSPQELKPHVLDT